MRYPTPALWRINVLSVHDGDTITAYVDRGHDEFAEWDIRLEGVFAPELRQVGGPDCELFVEGWLAKHTDGSVWPFLLQTERTPRSDKDVATLGRYVGRVTAADGACLNDDVQAYITAHGYPGGIGS